MPAHTPPNARLPVALSLMVALLLLAGCSSSSPEIGTPASSPRPIPPTSEPDPAAPIPQARRAQAQGPAAAAPHTLETLLKLFESDAHALRPTDPATADDLPNYEPIDLEQAADTLLSPDGRTMAMSITPRSTQCACDSTLCLLDLATWSLTPVEDVPRGLGPAAWSPDGARLYALDSSCSTGGGRGGCVDGWRHQLWAVDAPSARGRLVMEPDFWPAGVHLAPDGSRLYLLGYRSDSCCGIDVVAPPFLAIVDIEAGQVLEELPLPRVTVGQWIEQREHGQFGVQVWPASTLAPDGERLYVVESESDRLTVVDLDRIVVEQVVRLAPPRSPLERLGGWLRDLVASRAEAKGGLSHRRQLAVSPDGSRLYVTGSDSDTCAGRNYFACARVPFGLLVVDTGTMRVVHEEPLVDSFVLTPDGERILATGSYFDNSDHPEAESIMTGLGLKILDARSLELLAHFEEDAVLRPPAVSRDGRYAHLATPGPGFAAEPATSTTCAAACARIAVLDLELAGVVAERIVDAHSAGPVGLAPPR